MLNLTKSQVAFARAQELMPGGVNSPVRSFANVDSNPPFIARGEGANLYDIDGNKYIDYVLSWGPMIVGHAHPLVVEAITKAAHNGTSYGAPTEIESKLAEKIMELIPSIEKIRMVNSGTEATMSAIRLARGFTGRNKIVKFIGCYHGHVDSLLVKAGSGLATFGQPNSPGVTPGTAQDTITLPYNDEEAFISCMNEYGDDIAAVIIEPVAGNMGLVLPHQGYLATIRRETEKHGTLLIFDEVMCGFRVALNGAQASYGIRPDLTCLGKIIGGGLPVAAYGGRRDIMDWVSPKGPVYQAGTLSGNPLAMAAGLATMEIISAEPEWKEPDYSRQLTLKTKTLLQGIKDAATDAGVAIQAHQAGSMFGIFFNDAPVIDYETAASSNQEAFGIWFLAMLEQGIYLAPSQFETMFMSGAHTSEDIATTIEAAKVAMRKVAIAMN